jgi:D-alanyl-D-alanine carboxypeptidase
MLYSTFNHAQIDSNLTTQFQQFLVNQKTIFGDYGISASVIMPNGDQWNGQTGVDSAGNTLTDSTVFYGASTLKVYMASTILQLESSGQLSLNDLYTQYIAPINNADTTITIRQLLNHSSGNFNFVDNSNYLPSIIGTPTNTFAPGAALTSFFNQAGYFTPGTSWHYSNANYVILGLIIESITGNSLQSELRSRFWTPLNMRHSYLGGFESYSEAVGGLWGDPFSSGTLTDYNSISHNALLTSGWGTMNIVTTPADAATFVRALLTGQVLADSSLQKMMTWVDDPTFASYANDYDYGLGLERQIRYAGDTLLGHTGDLGNITYMFHSITSGYTIVTMTNSEVATPEYAFIFISQLLHNTVFTNLDETAQKELEIVVFPNPATSSLHITADLTFQSLTIYNASGQLIHSQNYSNTLDISGLGSGLYYLYLDSEKGAAFKSFVKQ